MSVESVLYLVTGVSLAAALAAAAVARRVLREERRRSATRVAALGEAIDEAEGTPDAHRTGAGRTLFDAAPAAGRASPLITAAVGVVVAVSVIVAVSISSHGPGAAAGPERAAALELIAMRHARDGSTLTVSGLVRNPRTGEPIDGVAAVVLAFDRSGTFVASARSPLEFARLRPGEESPFIVTLPGVSDIGRYRVSFRTDAGVVRHNDRRAAAPHQP